MKILALETSGPAGGAALLDGDRLRGEYTLNILATHSERVMTAVDRLLDDAGWRTADLEGLALAVGPGSFTGLRIGIATVQGLALALGLPIAAVPTLDGLAATLPFASLPVCPILDARKGEVYASLYRWDGHAMHREWDYVALTPEDLAQRLTEPVIVVGDGAARIDSPFAHPAPPARRSPSPACVAQFGHAMLAAGSGVAPGEIRPIYLRPSEAELRAREKIAATDTRWGGSGRSGDRSPRH
jgi:tRNA threonylcarbamoyladenosine biosynthesis protein TsaB